MDLTSVGLQTRAAKLLHPRGRFSPKYAVGGPDNHEPTRRNGHVVDVKTVGYITYCKNI